MGMGIREDSEHENKLLKQACCVYTICPQKKKDALNPDKWNAEDADSTIHTFKLKLRTSGGLWVFPLPNHCLLLNKNVSWQYVKID